MAKKQKTEDRKQKPEPSELNMNRVQQMSKSMAEGREWKKLLSLAELLKKEPELATKLTEALEAGRFLITVSCQKKKTANDEHDLQHFWTCHSYNHNDVVSTLKHLAADFTAKEKPTGRLAEDKGWH